MLYQISKRRNFLLQMVDLEEFVVSKILDDGRVDHVTMH